MARTYLGYTQTAANADLDALAAGSASSAWSQSGSGTVARTISSKICDVQNVADFGVLPSGDDMRTAMQGALDNATAGVLVCGPGTYVMSGELTVSRPILLLGAGMGATIFRFTALGSGKAGFKVTANNATLRDFTVRGPSVAAYVLDECGVWFYGTQVAPIGGAVAENVEVYDVGAYGLLYEYANRARAIRNYVHDVGYGGIGNLSSADWVTAENVVDTITPGTSSNAYGLFVSKRLTGDTGPTRGTMSKNVIKNVALWEGIDTHGGTFYTINDNIVSGCKIGIQVGPDSFGNVPHFTTITGNAIDNGGLTTTQLRGISIGGDSGTNVRGVVCKGNTIDTMGGADGSSGLLGAIIVQYTIGSIVSGNTLYAAEQNGIIYDGGGNLGVVCTDNAIHGVTLRTGNASGIRFNTATTGVCAGNYIDASDNYPMYFNVACASLRMDDTNVFITDGTAPASGIIVVNPANAGRGYTMQGTNTVDIGSLADGQGTDLDITVTGAALGDFVTASCSLDVESLIITAAVRAVNAVEVRIQNETGAPVDIGSAIWAARVVRR